MTLHRERCWKGLISFLLLFLQIPPCICIVTVTENTYVEGTIQKAKMEEFAVTTKIDWRYYQFTFTLCSMEGDMSFPEYSPNRTNGTRVAQVSLFCGEHQKDRNIYNNSTLSLFDREISCSKEYSNFTITNCIDSILHYVIIVQRMDDISTSFQMNSEIHSSISGYSTDSMRSYRIYVASVEQQYPFDNGDDDDLIVDMFQITLASSSPSSLKGYLSQSAYPLNKNHQELLFNETSQKASIWVDFTSSLYNVNHDIYLILLVEEESDSLISYSLSSECKSSLQVLPNTLVSGMFEEGVNCTAEVESSEAKGYAILDLTSVVIYDDVELTFMVDDFVGNATVVLSNHTLRTPSTGPNEDTVQVTGRLPLKYTLYRNSPLFQLRGLLYMLLRVPLPESPEVPTTPCIFSILSNFTQNYTIHMLDYDHPIAITTENKTTLQYYALWVPAEGFGKIESIKILLSDIHYFWILNNTVSTPLSLYISYNEQPVPSSILDSSSIKKEVTLYYQTSYELTIEPEDVSLYLIIAIETLGTSSWTLQTPITITPYAPTPGSPVQGYVSTYETSIQSYIYLYVLEYTPVVLSASKLSNDYRSLTLLVSIDQYPTLEDYDWKEEHGPTTETFSVNVTLSRSHPKYCSKCKYYMTVYLFNATTVSQDATYLSLDFLCSPQYCSRCSEGWDPQENCKECLRGYYGTSCLPCPNCNHGMCFDRQVGNGTCTCDVGFTEASNCTDCSNGYYGEDCLECPFCNNHGTCNDGKTGDGTCACDDGFDSAVLCNNCLSGYYGSDCSKLCLGNLTCSGHGVCDDGMDGSGRCTCREGYVGLQCDTLYEHDKCNPHCYTENGACDEEKGICVCYDDHSGVDCNYNWSEMVNMYILLSLVIVISIISFFFMYGVNKWFEHRLRVKRQSKKKEKARVERKMVIDSDNRTISWRAVTPTSKKMVTYEPLHEDEEY